MTKKSWQPKKFRFDGWFGILITLGNWMDGIFNSYCHTELDFMDGTSFSAFEGGGRTDPKTGRTCSVGFKDIEYSHPERWEAITIDVTDPRLPRRWKSKAALRLECVRLSGRDYDVLGCIGQAIGIDSLQDDKKDFCSEVVGGMFGVFRMSPARLYNKLKEIFND